MAMGGEFPVAPIKNLPAQGHDGEKKYRIRPPDSPHGVTIGVRAGNQFSVREQQPQILQALGVAQPQFFFDPTGLQRRDFETSFAQGIFPERNPAAADAAGIIVKNPARRIGFGVVHGLRRTPLYTVTAEPSARKADAGEEFKALQNTSP